MDCVRDVCTATPRLCAKSELVTSELCQVDARYVLKLMWQPSDASWIVCDVCNVPPIMCVKNELDARMVPTCLAMRFKLKNGVC